MVALNVELGTRSYPIHIGRGLLDNPDILRTAVSGRNVVIISNETVAPLYLNKVRRHLDDLRVGDIILPDGEQYKTLGTLESIFTQLLEGHFDRNTTLIALGGGVVGDIAGFAAASYQRGIKFVQIPTTLLAQVDSSVGGKTGVNHPLGKNMIGAFHQPLAVIIDTETLDTLPDRELNAGLAEVIKYGLLGDAEFFDWLEENIDTLRARDHHSLAYAIKRSCQNKASIVAQDEREQGSRALLNLGHTFGHAIETGLGYGQWLHGEAVACGMLMAARLSGELGWLPTAAIDRIEALLLKAGLPVTPPAELSQQRMRELMAIDKKVIDGQLRLVLLRDIGHALVTDQFDPAALDRVLTPSKAA
ncbi:3-dehydroquinate synthase [Acidihalobacter ferrooxydans]|uniref:3-dehydroquinate synthase n=1 Tax=Acidihalobacter ferrooxydans TaxID=1765967 RepID=A0A1P8UKG5_9GAMM|nr:3-dehydroquinate synthase [Acidihalobacter ferrooxydans]APZ44323.1 3-dehydroquinate synthase [Acidihalobacter ferrooxydans]